MVLVGRSAWFSANSRCAAAPEMSVSTRWLPQIGAVFASRGETPRYLVRNDLSEVSGNLSGAKTGIEYLRRSKVADTSVDRCCRPGARTFVRKRNRSTGSAFVGKLSINSWKLADHPAGRTTRTGSLGESSPRTQSFTGDAEPEVEPSDRNGRLRDL